MARTLYALRHANAAPGRSIPDRERALDERGRGEARALGVHIAGLPVPPQRVLVSSAERTRETLGLIGASWAPASEPVNAALTVAIGRLPTTLHDAPRLSERSSPLSVNK